MSPVHRGQATGTGRDRKASKCRVWRASGIYLGGGGRGAGAEGQRPVGGAPALRGVPPTLVMPFPMILREGGEAHSQLGPWKALGSQLPDWPRPGACSLMGNQGPGVCDPAQLCPAAVAVAAAAARRPPAPEGSDGGSRCRRHRRRRRRLLLPLRSCGAPSPVGPGGGPDKDPVCGAHGPRDNGSLLRPRGTPPPEVGAGRSPHPGTVRRHV